MKRVQAHCLFPRRYLMPTSLMEPGGIDPYKSYKTLFDGTYQPELVKEYIYFSKKKWKLYSCDTFQIGGNIFI